MQAPSCPLTPVHATTRALPHPIFFIQDHVPPFLPAEHCTLADTTTSLFHSPVKHISLHTVGQHLPVGQPQNHTLGSSGLGGMCLLRHC